MDRDGRWRLSPAFEVIWSYNSKGEWTNRHQMTINGKSDGIEQQDIIEVAKKFNIKKPLDIIADIGSTVRNWPDYADKAGVSSKMMTSIAKTHRLQLVL